MTHIRIVMAGEKPMQTSCMFTKLPEHSFSNLTIICRQHLLFISSESKVYPCFPKFDSFVWPVLWLNSPFPPVRGLSPTLSSLGWGLFILSENSGLCIHVNSLDGVAVELVTLGLHTCLISPRLLVITPSKISPSSANDAALLISRSWCATMN